MENWGRAWRTNATDLQQSVKGAHKDRDKRSLNIGPSPAPREKLAPRVFPKLLFFRVAFFFPAGAGLGQEEDQGHEGDGERVGEAGGEQGEVGREASQDDPAVRRPGPHHDGLRAAAEEDRHPRG